jgi:hypothetical protein
MTFVVNWEWFASGSPVVRQCSTNASLAICVLREDRQRHVFLPRCGVRRLCAQTVRNNNVAQHTEEKAMIVRNFAEGRNMLWIDPRLNEIFVSWDGRGTTEKSRVRIYATVAKARKENFAPCGAIFGEQAVAVLGLEGA